jgi:hypothetical protein
MPKRDDDLSLAERIERLELRGVTKRPDQAAELGMGLSTLHRHLKREGMTQSMNYRDWIPWTIAAEHHSDEVGRKLRRLAQAADGRDTPMKGRRGNAVQWATRLVERRRDVAYSREKGFSIVIVSPHAETWYLKDLLEAANRFIKTLPQLDDLGEHTN